MNLRNTRILCAAVAFALALPAFSASASPQSASEQAEAWGFLHRPAMGLVQAVREATAGYQNVQSAIVAGYFAQPFGCVSSPETGAMGIHYINPDLLDDKVEVDRPEMLVYEPMPSGRLRLVAADYVVDAEAWDTRVSDGSPPVLMGQLFDYVAFPNRFRVGAFYNLHVWAWQYNPNGVFSMWNPRVSCADYTE